MILFYVLQEKSGNVTECHILGTILPYAKYIIHY